MIRTEGSLGTKESSVNAVVVRESVSAIDASCLNRMVSLRIEHRIYLAVASPLTHSLSLTSRERAKGGAELWADFICLNFRGG